jgi:hypothetical protein
LQKIRLVRAEKEAVDTKLSTEANQHVKLARMATLTLQLPCLLICTLKAVDWVIIRAAAKSYLPNFTKLWRLVRFVALFLRKLSASSSTQTGQVTCSLLRTGRPRKTGWVRYKDDEDLAEMTVVESAIISLLFRISDAYLMRKI